MENARQRILSQVVPPKTKPVERTREFDMLDDCAGWYRLRSANGVFHGLPFPWMKFRPVLQLAAKRIAPEIESGRRRPDQIGIKALVQFLTFVM